MDTFFLAAGKSSCSFDLSGWFDPYGYGCKSQFH